ncbi:MAG TPA: ATP-binding protein, partial [Candidatus Acidoferrum sp.]|nr:ATP-binding protein [Candidatus Acidoferrum sp.]
RSQVEVLSAVTEEYLRFARLPKPKLEVGAVAPMIEDLAEFVREDLRARKVNLVVAVADGLPAMRLDAGQIRRGLLNLVRNAAEAMPDGGTLTLRVNVFSSADLRISNLEMPNSQSAIVMEIADTGVGIPPENLERIFEPFFTNKEGGTGLGLAIARQIAVDQGGSLTCESTQGVGTTFRLTLPIPNGERLP